MGYQGIFFTADTHFGHAKIIEYCKRPFSSVEEMNEALIANWNRVVAPNDLVFHLGDFCFGSATIRAILPRLNGQKNLVLGNHDYRSQNTYRQLEGSGIVWIDEGPCKWQHFLLCHYPYAGDTQEEDRYLDRRPEDNGGLLLHGHVHNQWKINDRQYNVGVDVNDYAPVPVEDILAALRNNIPSGGLAQ